MKYKLEPGEIIPLTDDDMFTEIFNNKDNICIIEEFIASYFNYELNEVRGNIKILPRKLKKGKAKEKSKEIDLLLEYNKKKYNIEMTTGWNQSIKDRNVVFLCNIHGRQLDKGEEYNKIDESVQINLCSFTNKNKKRETYYLINNEGEKLTNKLKIEVIYMAKLKDMCYTKDDEMNKLIRWSKVFESKTEEELEDVLDETLSNSSKKQLISEVTRLSGDEKMVSKYKGKSKWEWTRDVIMEDLMEQQKQIKEESRKLKEKILKVNEKSKKVNEKSKKVREESQKVKEELNQIKEERKNIIQNMLNENMDKNKISNILGISLEEIEKIKNSLQSDKNNI